MAFCWVLLLTMFWPFLMELTCLTTISCHSVVCHVAAITLSPHEAEEEADSVVRKSEQRASEICTGIQITSNSTYYTWSDKIITGKKAHYRLLTLSPSLLARPAMCSKIAGVTLWPVTKICGRTSCTCNMSNITGNRQWHGNRVNCHDVCRAAIDALVLVVVVVDWLFLSPAGALYLRFFLLAQKSLLGCVQYLNPCLSCDEGKETSLIAWCLSRSASLFQQKIWIWTMRWREILTNRV